MRKQIKHKGYTVIYEAGYIAEKDIELIVYGLGKNASEHEGSLLPNLMHYSFDVIENDNECHVELAISYIALSISKLVRDGDIDRPETLEQELYLATLSAHSKNSRYLNVKMTVLKEDLKWIYMKRERPELRKSMEMVLGTHRDYIDKELSQ